MIGREGVGALVYLPQEGRGIGLIEKLKAYALQDQGLDTVEANQALGFRADLRDYGIGLQILQDLGLSKVRLLTNNPKKADAFVIQGHGLEVVDQVPIIAPEEADRTRYLAAKRDKMGHRLPGSIPDGVRSPDRPLTRRSIAYLLPAGEGGRTPDAGHRLTERLVRRRRVDRDPETASIRPSGHRLPREKVTPIWSVGSSRRSRRRLGSLVVRPSTG